MIFVLIGNTENHFHSDPILTRLMNKKEEDEQTRAGSAGDS